MKIGLSLRPNYVLDTDGTTSQTDFFRWVGKPLVFLEDLRQYGVTSVELQGVSPILSGATELAAMQCIEAAQLNQSFHSHLPDWDVTKAASADFSAPPLPDMRAFLNTLDISPVMVVHPCDTSTAHYEKLVTATITGLQALIQNLKLHALPIRVALEINRYNGANVPGVTYEGLLEIGKHFSNDDLGFCWDMGHTQSSFLQKKLPEAPPPEFTSRVIHTHIHDVSQEGGTHRALRESCPYLESSIRRLETFGYTGVYNLELYPNRWEPEINVKDTIFQSVERLKAMLQNKRRIAIL